MSETGQRDKVNCSLCAKLGKQGCHWEQRRGGPHEKSVCMLDGRGLEVAKILLGGSTEKK